METQELDFKKSLYIFDFDETLIRVNDKVRIFDKETNETIQVVPHQYYQEFYKPSENEGAEYIDTDKYSVLPYLNVMKEAISQFGNNDQKHVWICTARSSTDEVKKILSKEGLSGVPIAAVGNPNIGHDNIAFNANQKRVFVNKLAQRIKPDIIFFYDDIEQNLQEVGSLAKSLKIKVVCANTKTHRSATFNP